MIRDTLGSYGTLIQNEVHLTNWAASEYIAYNKNDFKNNTRNLRQTEEQNLMK
jgi:hypothetical protein